MLGLKRVCGLILLGGLGLAYMCQCCLLALAGIIEAVAAGLVANSLHRL